MPLLSFAVFQPSHPSGSQGPSARPFSTEKGSWRRMKKALASGRIRRKDPCLFSRKEKGIRR
ncbi:hypothetical protein B4135_4102 [Caldibacillus debilis]|uniref:Uncharacterized protein n=1 Tax=Caldibacillus debilis TaxID=301148 RepID=A0A150L7Z2_9BACI|nr:hypothetical protein B4135_4102 [Caldibacillus debilis]